MYYIIFLLPLMILIFSTSASDSTWAPFQSQQVKEICSHMTAKERKSAVRRGATFGLILAIPAFLCIPVGQWLFDSALIGVLIIQSLAFISVVVLLLKYRPLIDKSQKEFLASTKWAQECGLTPDKIILRNK